VKLSLNKSNHLVLFFFLSWGLLIKQGLGQGAHLNVMILNFLVRSRQRDQPSWKYLRTYVRLQGCTGAR